MEFDPDMDLDPRETDAAEKAALIAKLDELKKEARDVLQLTRDMARNSSQPVNKALMAKEIGEMNAKF